MVKGRIEFSISFLEPGGNYVLNGNVQLLCCINSNCVFSKTIPLWGQASQSVSRQGSYIGSFLNLKMKTLKECYIFIIYLRTILILYDMVLVSFWHYTRIRIFWNGSGSVQMIGIRIRNTCLQACLFILFLILLFTILTICK